MLESANIQITRWARASARWLLACRVADNKISSPAVTCCKLDCDWWNSIGCAVDEDDLC